MWKFSCATNTGNGYVQKLFTAIVICQALLTNIFQNFFGVVPLIGHEKVWVIFSRTLQLHSKVRLLS